MLDETELTALLRDACNLEKYAIARVISHLERSDGRMRRRQIFQKLHKMGVPENKGFTVGITGTPGAGKSSLIGEMIRHFLAIEKDKSIAIVAIDPSSQSSGGSILGDRTRVILPRREKRVYFRSQASQLELGGVNPYTYHVIRFLRYLFDYVIVETVGIGQNEIEVSLLCDLSFLVLQPLGGDQVQFMKSGIMETPDAFIINKCDEESLANSSYHLLLTTLEFLKDVLPGRQLPPVFKTSVVKKTGIEEVYSHIAQRPSPKDQKVEAWNQLEKWIRNEYGRFGVRIVRSDRDSIFANSKNYEEMENRFLELLKVKASDELV
ncbi:protein kinase [Leptospira sp. GIMC2001]|uniref:protein kinase n=1 Tax=Leptospira sp. GIMC2001 TaxID=1513297 RepID=UPI00234A152E|nr:protein kinase [Leptospira sp. GIMC2001]WCL47830.1 protein kinase [Leptospira sp. GIMC2001]